MIGKIEYSIVSDSEALMDIQFVLSEDYLNHLYDKNKHNKHLFFVIDRSGSMSNCIDEVRECAKRCIQQHFTQKKKTSHAPHQLLFDHELTKNEDNDMNTQLRFLDQNCTARGGTDFVLPLTDIMQFINTQPVNSVYVLFMTDGGDGNVSKTIDLAN